MDFTIVKNLLELFEKFDSENVNNLYIKDIAGFRNWIYDKESDQRRDEKSDPVWDGKELGRSPESVISTLLVHLNRYAKTYSKSAIAGSDFSTQDEFIYLINLKSFGSMTKMELIRKNVQEKPAGILIINRLIKQGWVEQKDSVTDRRTKVLTITESGLQALEMQMDKIRTATSIVTGNLTYNEKMDLIRILDKLEQFHHPIFSKNIDNNKLIDTVLQDYSFDKN
ncbi:MarR family winged helix-turn-helix transcriptional regulator [Epilithonimonas hominis]|uniref:MarR family winged helix-turn-helix transcriptional regulator n=1 Tax=Epilithonimonas hominis TaxID=420404 RepID=UPI00289AB625|nr:helix-turn-helix domain-containing protein [Epilithonimonas hominis]